VKTNAANKISVHHASKSERPFTPIAKISLPIMPPWARRANALTIPSQRPGCASQIISPGGPLSAVVGSNRLQLGPAWALEAKQRQASGSTHVKNSRRPAQSCWRLQASAQKLVPFKHCPIARPASIDIQPVQFWASAHIYAFHVTVWSIAPLWTR